MNKATSVTESINLSTSNNYNTKKLIINSHGNLRFISQPEISHCKSDNSYTTIFLKNGDEPMICKSLKKVILELDPDFFIRVSQSYLINKNHIKLIEKKNRHIELFDGKRIPFTTMINELLTLMKETAL